MTDRLTEGDKHHWHPSPALFAWLAGRLPADARVLDVGAGILPFPRANVLIDIAEPNRHPDQEWIKSDFSRDPLPFADKSFDFVYCRHVVEDMFNPFPLIREMARVGRAGYIETPSPMAEMCRGIDGSSPPWRGYYHHHFIVWPHAGELRFVMKYPLVEYLDVQGLNVAATLRNAPHLWNSHYLWEGDIKVAHRESLIDFHLFNEYGQVLTAAIEQGRISSDVFWAEIPRIVTIPQIGLNSWAAA